jgi:hypothetical protein
MKDSAGEEMVDEGVPAPSRSSVGRAQNLELTTHTRAIVNEAPGSPDASFARDSFGD